MVFLKEQKKNNEIMLIVSPLHDWFQSVAPSGVRYWGSCGIFTYSISINKKPLTSKTITKQDKKNEKTHQKQVVTSSFQRMWLPKKTNKDNATKNNQQKHTTIKSNAGKQKSENKKRSPLKTAILFLRQFHSLISSIVEKTLDQIHATK